MRDTNFALRRARPVGAVGTCLTAIVLSLGGLLVAALVDVRRIGDDLEQTVDHSARLAEQIVTLRQQAQTAPDISRLRRQAERVTYFNGMIGPRSLSMVEVLALLEDRLPQGLWVSQASYSVENGRLSLSIRTEEETALPPALKRLESDPALDGVILERQVRLQQGGRQLVQYDIEAVTR
jgi:hypothetical protein